MQTNIDTNKDIDSFKEPNQESWKVVKSIFTDKWKIITF